MRCNDCRQPNCKPKISRRSDVCDLCWNRRLAMISKVNSGTIESGDIHNIQREMLADNGAAAVLMDAELGKPHGDYSI